MENSYAAQSSQHALIKTSQREFVPRCVIVAGTASKAGKTSVAAACVRMLSAQTKSVGAAKITVTHGERGCPHGGKGCNVCSTLGGDFQITSKQSIIEQPGTDTAKLYDAGASPVLWTITGFEHVAAAWRQMYKSLRAADSIVVESNTLALTITPELCLMMVDPTVRRRLWKPSAETLIQCADLVIYNKRGTTEEQNKLDEELRRLRPSKEIIYVEHPDRLAANDRFTEHLSQLIEPSNR